MFGNTHSMLTPNRAHQEPTSAGYSTSIRGLLHSNEKQLNTAVCKNKEEARCSSAAELSLHRARVRPQQCGDEHRNKTSERGKTSEGLRGMTRSPEPDPESPVPRSAPQTQHGLC